MIRRAEQTVRWPAARIAPTARTWALAQARSENNGTKAASRAMISGGRSTGVVSRVGNSSTTIDPGQCSPGSASRLGQSRVRRIVGLDSTSLPCRIFVLLLRYGNGTVSWTTQQQERRMEATFSSVDRAQAQEPATEGYKSRPGA